jgi:protein tyrosine phosphatase (PTP) superfamily phosphohydrolase (DUF442 family)
MALNYNFVQVSGKGHLALSEHPKIQEIPQLRQDGCDLVITILGRRGENAAKIGAAVQASGLTWNWLKVSQIKNLSPMEERVLRTGMATVVGAIEAGESVLVHCSAGLHRTGVFAYGVLANGGLSHDQAMAVIGEMRAVTALALEAGYVAIAKSFVPL